MKRKRVVWLAACLSAALFLASALHGGMAQAAPAWNCDGLATNCHGGVYYDWGRPGFVDGLAGTMSISITNCGSCVWNKQTAQLQHINNSRWLADTRSAISMQWCGALGCWIEVGNIATADPKSGTLTQRYYWADNRPCVTSGDSYFPHYGGISTGDIGHTAYAQIDGSGGSDVCGIVPNTWNVVIAGPTAGISGTSTNNPMMPNWIELGGEIEGEPGFGQHTGDTYFTGQEYLQAANMTWYYFGGNHTQYGYDTNGPFQSYWTVFPENSSTGGTWYTNCPC